MNRKLTDEQIIEIRRVGRERAKLPSDRELAERFGVTVRAIRYHIDNRSKPIKTHVSHETVDIDSLVAQLESSENADRQ